LDTFPDSEDQIKKIDPKEVCQDWKSGRNLILVQYPRRSYVLNSASVSWKAAAQESRFGHFPGLGGPNKKNWSKRSISRSEIREEFIFGPISMDILCFELSVHFMKNPCARIVFWALSRTRSAK
jgi:hypothetical protein